MIPFLVSQLNWWGVMSLGFPKILAQNMVLCFSIVVTGDPIAVVSWTASKSIMRNFRRSASRSLLRALTIFKMPKKWPWANPFNSVTVYPVNMGIYWAHGGRNEDKSFNLPNSSSVVVIGKYLDPATVMDL